jgi:dephospho-CoA kinase
VSFVVGLAGGIGCGKSAVADRLVARGAVLIDADVVAREVVVPGGPAYQPLVDRFGSGILASDGTIDRPALAAVAFADPQALADLNAITHPAIGVSMVAQREALAETDAIVAVAIPLLKTEHRQSIGLDAVVVVDCPVEVALGRLVEQRGLSPKDAAARMAAQMSREERLAQADYVVDNAGSLDHLEAEVARLWDWLLDSRREKGVPARSG